jgi:hypothetical protein
VPGTRIKPTRIAVQYLRQIEKCLTERRLKRVRKRFRFLTQAHDIWQAAGAQRLEVETRILARQNDTAIGLAMDLPPETVQAYADIFYAVRNKIDNRTYIARQVIGLPWQGDRTPVELMQMSAYLHGPHVIEAWLAYLQDVRESPDLKTAAGRMAASLDLFLAVHALPEDAETNLSLVKRLPLILQHEWQFAVSVPAAQSLRTSTTQIVGDVPLPEAELAPFSYAPAPESPEPTRRQKDRQAA